MTARCHRCNIQVIPGDLFRSDLEDLKRATSEQEERHVLEVMGRDVLAQGLGFCGALCLNNGVVGNLVALQLNGVRR